MNNIMSSTVQEQHDDEILRHIAHPFTGKETVSVELPLTQWQELYETLLAARTQLYYNAHNDRERDSAFSPYSQRDYELMMLMSKRLFSAIRLNVSEQISFEAECALLDRVDYDDAYISIIDKCREREKEFRDSHVIPF